MINTYEDLKKYALKNSDIHLKNTFDEDSLKVYDYMMQYLADRDISFKIYSCINYSNLSNRKYDYKIEFVLSEYEEKCYIIDFNSLLPKYLCEIVYNSHKNEISTDVDSFINYMEWQKNVTDEFNDIYPDYHINFYCNLTKTHKNQFFKKYFKKNDDKKYINVFVPHDIVKDELDKIYEGMKPFLKKYKIDRVHYLKTRTNEILEDIIKNEDLIHNYYCKDKDIIWAKYYYSKDNIKYKYNKKEEKYEENKFYFIYKILGLPKDIITIIVAIPSLIILFILLGYFIYDCLKDDKQF